MVTFNLEGQVFGRLVVVERAAKKPNKSDAQWKCFCDPQRGGCGGTAVVSSGNLRNGRTKSCGCLLRDMLLERNKSSASVTHGLSHTPEYSAWKGMKRRCYSEKDPYYKDYGGRGITVCDEWRTSFEAFYRDMGPRPSNQHSLDRRENDKGYYKDNCRWATKIEQSSNTRKNLFHLYNGMYRTLAGWCREFGLDYHRSYGRMQIGWSISEIIAGKREENS